MTTNCICYTSKLICKPITKKKHTVRIYVCCVTRNNYAPNHITLLKNSIFSFRYKIDPSTPGWRHVGLKKVLLETVHYATPFLLLDFTTVKKYPGVNPSEWSMRRSSFIQTTRALPPNAPSILDINCQLLGAFVLFDIFFCFIHYALHRNGLYR